MSKVKKNDVVEEVQPDNLEPVAQPEEESTEACVCACAPVKKNKAARFFAVVLALLSIGVFFIPMLGVLDSALAVQEQMLFKALTDVFASETKAFDAVPVLTSNSVLGSLAGLALYVLVVSMAASLLLSVIAVFCKAKAPKLLNKAFGVFAFGNLVYTLSIMGATTANGEMAIDLISVALAAVGVVAAIVTAFIRNGKAAVSYVFHSVLTIVAFAVVVLGTAKSATALKEIYTEELDTNAILTIASVVILALCALFACCRFGAKKGIAFDIVRYVLTLVAAVILGIVIAGSADAKELRTFSIIAIVIAVAQIVISIIQIRFKGKEEVEEAKIEAESGFEVEEYAEAFPYDGGPVAGVVMAEEVNPTFAPAPTQVNTAGYDFYNSKSFDPFIASLNAEERNQFTELFILKFKGVMPEIPEYEVGGNNKEFFRKVFIYLGQYRDRIPNGLLAKIYQFSLKIS